MTCVVVLIVQMPTSKTWQASLRNEQIFGSDLLKMWQFSCMGASMIPVDHPGNIASISYPYIQIGITRPIQNTQFNKTL